MQFLNNIFIINHADFKALIYIIGPNLSHLPRKSKKQKVDQKFMKNNNNLSKNKVNSG